MLHTVALTFSVFQRRRQTRLNYQLLEKLFYSSSSRLFIYNVFYHRKEGVDGKETQKPISKTHELLTLVTHVRC